VCSGEEFFKLNPEPLLIVISGPSGVGKDSVIHRMQQRGLPFHFVITTTTRAPRPEEVNGSDYFFVSKDEFAEMIESGELLEYAFVYNDYKGVSKKQVREAFASHKDVVMRLDVQGAETISRLAPDTLLIFLTTQSEEELIKRLTVRKSETPEGLKLRIATAHQELKQIGLFDYAVVNEENQLDQTVDTIEAIINAEHHRVHQRRVAL
jgi:guanylate kinase